MAERSKVRLVRCPNCQNLLPELLNYSVYKCGGCGALLRASYKEKNGEDFEKLKSLSVRENDNSKQPIRSFVDRMNVSNESCQADYVMNRSKSVRSNKGQISVPDEPLRSEAIRGNSGAYVNRMANNRSRFSSFDYPGKGSSSYHLSSSSNGNRFAHLEQDRVELLRKLDELKEQICRSDSVERRNYDQHIEVKNFHFPQPGANAFPQFEQDYSRGEYIDYNQEQFVSNRGRSLYHGPVCACIRCCNTKVSAAVLDEKRAIGNRSALPPKSAKPGSRRPSDYYIDSNVGTFCPGKAVALPSKDANSGFRWPSDDINLNTGTCHPGKAAIAHQTVHPITGGSPFVTCYSCFEVLKLPRLRKKNQHKIKCGACSTVLSLESKSKRLTVTIRDDNIADASKEGPLRPRNVRFCTEETECSVDLDNVDYKRQNSTKSEKATEKTAFRSLEDEDDNSRDTNSIVVNTDFSYTSEKNLEKNVSPETEIECFSNEFDFSQDSIEVKFSERAAVFVNGQPIPDHIVKKVEKVAGRVQPGDYWYDFEAGFWGVMGHPCLGIIPPFIEEFNYPMTRNCGAGNTSVFVNGRELNERDLKLLASRGLPATEDKFYIIEISGRVYDRDTLKELCCLGKLAPTVEKLKRGFGMKVPRKLLTNEILV